MTSMENIISEAWDLYLKQREEASQPLNGTLEDLWHKIAQLEVPTPDDEHVRHDICADLALRLSVLGTSLGGTLSAEPHGSFVMGCYNSSSALEVAVTGKLPAPSIKDASQLIDVELRGATERLALLERVFSVVSDSGMAAQGTVSLNRTARVPSVSFEHASSGLPVRLCIAAPSLALRCQLVRGLVQFEPRLRGLVQLVELWADARGLNNPATGTFNSWALMNLAIFAAQTFQPQPLLPPLWRVCSVGDGASAGGLIGHSSLVSTSSGGAPPANTLSAAGGGGVSSGGGSSSCGGAPGNISALGGSGAAGGGGSSGGAPPASAAATMRPTPQRLPWLQPSCEGLAPVLREIMARLCGPPESLGLSAAAAADPPAGLHALFHWFLVLVDHLMARWQLSWNRRWRVSTWHGQVVQQPFSRAFLVPLECPLDPADNTAKSLGCENQPKHQQVFRAVAGEVAASLKLLLDTREPADLDPAVLGLFGLEVEHLYLEEEQEHAAQEAGDNGRMDEWQAPGSTPRQGEAAGQSSPRPPSLTQGVCDNSNSGTAAAAAPHAGLTRTSAPSSQHPTHSDSPPVIAVVVAANITTNTSSRSINPNSTGTSPVPRRAALGPQQQYSHPLQPGGGEGAGGTGSMVQAVGPPHPQQVLHHPLAREEGQEEEGGGDRGEGAGALGARGEQVEAGGEGGSEERVTTQSSEGVGLAAVGQEEAGGARRQVPQQSQQQQFLGVPSSPAVLRANAQVQRPLSPLLRDVTNARQHGAQPTPDAKPSAGPPSGQRSTPGPPPPAASTSTPARSEPSLGEASFNPFDSLFGSILEGAKRLFDNVAQGVAELGEDLNELAATTAATIRAVINDDEDLPFLSSSSSARKPRKLRLQLLHRAGPHTSNNTHNGPGSGPGGSDSPAPPHRPTPTPLSTADSQHPSPHQTPQQSPQQPLQQLHWSASGTPGTLFWGPFTSPSPASTPGRPPLAAAITPRQYHSLSQIPASPDPSSTPGCTPVKRGGKGEGAAAAGGGGGGSSASPCSVGCPTPRPRASSAGGIPPTSPPPIGAAGSGVLSACGAVSPLPDLSVSPGVQQQWQQHHQQQQRRHSRSTSGAVDGIWGPEGVLRVSGGGGGSSSGRLRPSGAGSVGTGTGTGPTSRRMLNWGVEAAQDQQPQSSEVMVEGVSRDVGGIPTGGAVEAAGGTTFPDQEPMVGAAAAVPRGIGGEEERGPVGVVMPGGQKQEDPGVASGQPLGEGKGNAGRSQQTSCEAETGAAAGSGGEEGCPLGCPLVAVVPQQQEEEEGAVRSGMFHGVENTGGSVLLRPSLTQSEISDVAVWGPTGCCEDDISGPSSITQLAPATSLAAETQSGGGNRVDIAGAGISTDAAPHAPPPPLSTPQPATPHQEQQGGVALASAAASAEEADLDHLTTPQLTLVLSTSTTDTLELVAPSPASTDISTSITTAPSSGLLAPSGLVRTATTTLNPTETNTADATTSSTCSPTTTTCNRSTAPTPTRKQQPPQHQAGQPRSAGGMAVRTTTGTELGTPGPRSSSGGGSGGGSSAPPPPPLPPPPRPPVGLGGLRVKSAAFRKGAARDSLVLRESLSTTTTTSTNNSRCSSPSNNSSPSNAAFGTRASPGRSFPSPSSCSVRGPDGLLLLRSAGALASPASAASPSPASGRPAAPPSLPRTLIRPTSGRLQELAECIDRAGPCTTIDLGGACFSGPLEAAAMKVTSPGVWLVNGDLALLPEQQLVVVAKDSRLTDLVIRDMGTGSTQTGTPAAGAAVRPAILVTKQSYTGGGELELLRCRLVLGYGRGVGLQLKGKGCRLAAHDCHFSGASQAAVGASDGSLALTRCRLAGGAGHGLCCRDNATVTATECEAEGFGGACAAVLGAGAMELLGCSLRGGPGTGSNNGNRHRNSSVTREPSTSCASSASQLPGGGEEEPADLTAVSPAASRQSNGGGFMELCSVGGLQPGSSRGPSAGGGVGLVAEGKGAAVTARSCSFQCFHEGSAALVVSAGASVSLEECRATDSRRGAMVGTRGGRLQAVRCEVSSHLAEGLMIGEGATADLRDSRLGGNGGSGLRVGGVGSVCAVWGCEVVGNGGSGVEVEAGAGVTMDGCTVGGNGGDGSGDGGRSDEVAEEEGDGEGGGGECASGPECGHGLRVAGPGARVMAQRCTLYDNAGAGVTVEDSGSVELVGCSMEGNGVRGEGAVQVRVGAHGRLALGKGCRLGAMGRSDGGEGTVGGEDKGLCVSALGALEVLTD